MKEIKIPHAKTAFVDSSQTPRETLVVVTDLPEHSPAGPEADRETITCAWSAREDIKTKSFPPRVLKKAKEPRTLEEMLMEIHAGRDLRREQAAANNPSVMAAKQAYEEAYAKAFAEAGED